jgi:ketosteroid isomerase-like protein
MIGRKLIGIFLCVATASCATSAANSAGVATTIKADVAEIVAGINAHDVNRATQFDADEIVSMESGRPPSFGLESEKRGLGMAFQRAPDWRLHLIDETVDVASSGDMALYRSTYDENSTGEGGVAMTHKVNFIAELRRQSNGAWKVVWSAVCAQERSHPV